MTSIVDELAAALGRDNMRIGEAIPARNREGSALGPPMPAVLPVALLLPRTTEEVATAMRICHDRGQRVVTQGGLTGLAAGAQPDAAEVVLSLERMTGIEEVDAAAATMTVRAGTLLQVVHEAAEAAGFLYGVDLGARGSCTIGGNIATNAGGNQVLRYGMTRRNVLGLEAVLADGTIVSSMNKMLKNNTGYDWVQLMIGSEGTLGIVTRAVLALQPRPLGIECALAAVASFDDALRLLRAAEQALPGGLMTYEGMWSEFYELATGPMGCSAPLARGHELYLLIEMAMGPEAGGADRFGAFLARHLEAGTLRDCVVAQSGPDRARIWALRESPYEYHTKLPPAASMPFDVSIPLARMGEAVDRFRRVIPEHWPDAEYAVFGHIADSNIHITVRLPGAAPEALTEVCKVVYSIVGDLGGSISAEHGIGRSKRPYLELSRSQPELALMATIKHALDPKGILNAGRVL